MQNIKKYYLPLAFIVLISVALLNIFQRADNHNENMAHIEAMARHADISIEHPIMDIGKVKRYGVAEARFRLINVGKVPFIISSVTVDCHCTVVDWSKVPVMSGNSTFITVRYDSSQPGFFLKKVTVFSNAKNSPTLLIIRGEIIL